MKSVVRKIDQIGRVVLPKNIRDAYDLTKEGDEVEIIDTGEGILLKRHTPECTFCGNKEDLIDHMGKAICKDCLKILNMK